MWSNNVVETRKTAKKISADCSTCMWNMSACAIFPYSLCNKPPWTVFTLGNVSVINSFQVLHIFIQRFYLFMDKSPSFCSVFAVQVNDDRKISQFIPTILSGYRGNSVSPTAERDFSPWQPASGFRCLPPCTSHFFSVLWPASCCAITGSVITELGVTPVTKHSPVKSLCTWR